MRILTDWFTFGQAVRTNLFIQTGSIARMSDERMIRIDNLRLFMSQKKWAPADLARELGVSDSYISALLNAKKPFGERTARKMESRLGMHSKWLDEPRLIDDENTIDGAGLIREADDRLQLEMDKADRSKFSPLAMHLAMTIDGIKDAEVRTKAFASAVLAIQQAIDQKGDADKSGQ